MRYLIEPRVTLHPDELYLYGVKEWISEKPILKSTSLLNLQTNHHHGKLSQKAKSKTKRAIKYMLLAATDKKVYNPKFKSSYSFKCNMVTLTLPSVQCHTDKEIKHQVLNQFFIESKKKWNLNNYVWKAERQGNGNLHFHILTDVFIPHNELRNTWNRLINKLGYVDKYKALHKKSNPNSTDIHSLYKIKNIYSYITKYMVKNECKQHSQVKKDSLNYQSSYVKGTHSLSNNVKKYLKEVSPIGRIWGCSHSLSNLTGAVDIQHDALMKEIEELQKELKTKRYNADYVSVLYFDSQALKPDKYPHLYNLLHSYLSQVFPSKVQHVSYPNLYPD